jgi:ATP-binding cassette, subfamily C (CFTR/MRP), member 1
VLANTPINLAPVVTFAVYVIISVFWKGESLLTAQAFTSLALVSLLTTPVIVFIQALPNAVQSINCFKRIQEYCNYGSDSENQDDSNIPQHPLGPTVSLQNLPPNVAKSPNMPLQGKSISFKGQSFSWYKQNSPILKDIHMYIKPGSITAIVGPVGSGKSSLFQSILGETIATPVEQRRIATPVAYCSQQSWLEHTTIRQNITGPYPYESKWYGVVVFSCGLEPDLDQLEKSDQTLVGSKGLNLSGGQKQRIVCSFLPSTRFGEH